MIYRTECYNLQYQVQFIHAHIPYFFTFLSRIRHLVSGTKPDNNNPKLGQCQHFPPWAITTDSLWHQAGVSINTISHHGKLQQFCTSCKYYIFLVWHLGPLRKHFFFFQGFSPCAFSDNPTEIKFSRFTLQAMKASPIDKYNT